MGKVKKHLAKLLAGWLILAAGCRQQPGANAPLSPAAAPAPSRIGGADVVTLVRKPTSGGAKPEFVSVTLLPGRAMNVFQVLAAIPGRGQIPLMYSPSLNDAAMELTGAGKDQMGNESFAFGGAFLVPYPNRIFGEPSTDGKSVLTQWRGHSLSLPANFPSKEPGGPTVAIHGLINQDRVEDLKTENTADGQTLTGVIHAGDFGGHWISDTDLTMTIALSGDALEATVSAKNVGKQPEPMAIGWHPYFAIPSKQRSQVLLHIPASMVAPVNNYGVAMPTGKLRPVKGTEYDYNAAGGVALDDHFLDDNFSHLQWSQGAAEVKLIDPASNYGLSVSALSPEIRTVQVYSPKDSTFVAIEDQFNYVDPFGKQWKGMDTGMVTLRPGQSVSWRVRLGLFKP